MSIISNAQLINTGWVYGGEGNQSAQRSYIDNSGNRYIIFHYDNEFFIDSLGTPILFKESPRYNPTTPYYYTYAIAKFDKNGIYQYHFEVFAEINGIVFDDADNIYICFSYTQKDTLILNDKYRNLYKTIIPVGNKSNQTNQIVFTVCKLNINGEYQWFNTIVKKNNSGIGGNSSPYFSYISINKSNEISCYYPNNRLIIDSLTIDTLIVTDYLGKETKCLINSQDILVKFSSFGVFLNAIEPLININHYANTYSMSKYRYFQSVNDGENTYAIINQTISKSDTFNYPNPLFLNEGGNFILIKIDGYGKIEWAKPLLRYINYKSNTYHLTQFKLDYDTSNQLLILSYQHNKNETDFILDSSFKINQNGEYVAKINPLGNILWQDFYENVSLSSYTYDYIGKRNILIGNIIYNPDIRFAQLLPPIQSYSETILFAATSDITNQIITAQPIISNSTNFSNSIFTYIWDYGKPITDKKGRTYITGFFYDSITLPCSTLYENPKNYNTNFDGFVLIIEALNNKDTLVCKNMLSPSGKYNWDSTGMYYDTLINAIGCDSIVLFNLKVLENNSQKDSVVCANMLSPSGKFWDSSGTYIDTIPNQFGCDSIITFTLTILQTKSTIDTTVLYSYLSPSKNYRWDSSDIYTDTISNFAGCDSIITIKLTVLKTPTRIDTSACDSLLSPSKKYEWDSTGIYYDTLITPMGFDSILRVSLTIVPFRLNLSKSNDVNCDSNTSLLEVSGGKTYLWSPENYLSNIHIFNPVATPTSTMYFYVLAKNEIGCELKDSIQIVVNRTEVLNILPNVFTPNNDGINDCFGSSPAARFKTVSFKIFDRWGILIYETENPNDCWNGKLYNKGNEVPSSVYFYVLSGTSICDQKINQKGSVTVFK